MFALKDVPYYGEIRQAFFACRQIVDDIQALMVALSP